MAKDPAGTSKDNPGSWIPPGDIAQAIEAWQTLVTKGYLLPGVYGSLSIKSPRMNLYGEEELVLWMTGSNGESPDGPESVRGLRLAGLRRLLDLDDLPASELENELHRSRLRAGDPMPAWESLLHIGFQQRCVFHTCPPALLAIASSTDGKSLLEQLAGASIGVLDFIPEGFQAARSLRRMLDSWEEDQPCYLVGFGLWASGADIESCLRQIEEIETKAQAYLQERDAWDIQLSEQATPEGHIRKRLASLRKEVSERWGTPVIFNQDMGFFAPALSKRLEQEPGFSLGPPTLYHARTTGFSQVIGNDRTAIPEAGLGGSNDGDILHALFPARVVLDKELGVCSIGSSATQAYLTTASFRNTIQAWLRAERAGGYHALQSWELLEATPSGVERTGRTLFSGEIALVTGGASGIGKACVESLLRRGAAVASMDINPAVVQIHAGADYLGLECDLTNEEAVLQAFEALVRRFGGLDMLVLNAGIFPAGIRIESLGLAHWQKVMQINLDSNLVVLREAHPLLLASPRGGRVLVNASKNVLAPGAGAAAYSSAKAAVTQLARVAALEWGKDKIRVNMIHPDAVFDTGIWTDEVLQARSAHYGMSVQQYKTRNLLGVELNSSYIGELVAEMLGPLFEKITGAQIPVDGGSDRVI